MKITHQHLILLLVLLATPLCTHADLHKENNKAMGLIKLIEAKKHKDKEKTPPVADPKEKLSFEQALQKLYAFSIEKSKQAQEKESSIPKRTFKNTTEVSHSLNDAAELYDSAARAIRQALQITQYFANKETLDNEILNMAWGFEAKANKCRKDASDWLYHVQKQKRALYEEIDHLKKECVLLEKQEVTRECQDVYKKMALILQKLIENGEIDTGELAICQKKIATLEAVADAQRFIFKPPQQSQDDFQKNELVHIDHFFHGKKREEISHYAAVPLDGQGASLYVQQFYHFLVQRNTPATHLRIKVFEDGDNIYEEQIDIPIGGLAWQHYLTSDEMLLVPKTILSSKFGLDLRLTAVFDPYYSFSIVIAQKGSSPKYDFSFFLDDEPLYDLHFNFPPPWQLEVLRKPILPPIEISILPMSSMDVVPIKDNGMRHPAEALYYPLLDQFVKELKKDPLAIARYVHNEIETVDPFLLRSNGVFQAPSIHRSPLRTFLENQGSPWEQCTLLVHLLRCAGYQAQYIEGKCTVPAPYVEQLLFLQLPGENEIALNYPGVLFSDGQQWHTLFPWMKEIHTHEGHDIYSLLPEEYGNAERWLKQYLCNDENILKHIGSDGDDTVGVLFVRFVEEHLRNQGLSLQDVGTHRVIHKKQFSTWQDFPRPVIKGNIKSSANLSSWNDLFANIKVIINSEQNPSKKIESEWMNLSAFSCGSYAIYFTPYGESGNLLHFCFSEDWKKEIPLLLDVNDKTINIEVVYDARIGPEKGVSVTRQFSIIKGTCAALCHHSGSSNAKLTSFYAEKFNKKDTSQEKLHALFSFIGAAYYEKCSRSAKILAALHKMTPTTYFCVGLAKLAPDHSLISDLRFPQVDMYSSYFTLDNNKHLFSPFKETHLAAKQYHILTTADASSNEHQVLREIYQDPYAISTVKLLQIAHQNHKKKGMLGTGFLIFTNKSFTDADANPGMAHILHFSHLRDLNLHWLKNSAKSQWEALRSLFKEKDHDYMYAYMTPGPVSSQDGYGLTPPSYTGAGTLIYSSSQQAAMISVDSRAMNGGFGSRLSDNFMQTINNSDWQLVSNGNNYSFIPKLYAPLFNGVTTSQQASKYQLPNFKLQEESKQLFTLWNNSLWAVPISTQWKADVRQEHKSFLDTVADPVDVVTGAFYVDEVDLNLPGAFPLEIRRNYSSQNPIPGFFGFGWKLSLNPFLFEEGNKIFVSEQDGTVVVYRRDGNRNRWIALPEDNPDLRNYNKQGIGGIANPFHAYIEKGNDHILYGVDGSKRIFHNKLLTTWSDHAGNILTFSYQNERLTRIDSSSGGFICFEYNHGGKISEAFTKDGRKVCYTYDFQGNLSSVTLPNNATIAYEYDRFHRIIRETKPHGRVLENVYKDDKVVEQRSPVGSGQQMSTSATFSYADGVTIVTDGAEGRTEYKIYKKQIYKITDPEGHQTLQSWFLDNNTYFDAESEQIQQWNQTGAYPRSLKSSTDKRGLTTKYLYDAKGNPQEICIIGEDLTGNTDTIISKRFVYNTHNLCIQEETLNTKTTTVYDTIRSYLPKRIEKFVDDKLISFIDIEYTSHGQVYKLNDCGTITILEYDYRDFPKKKIQQTGTDDPDVITSFLYNEQGQCIDLITADSIQHNEYDIMGNKCCSIVSLPSGKILSKTYAGYDFNNELIWKQSDDPNDSLFFDYNAVGLLKATRKNLSQINESLIEPAGVAYTLYEYDTCGRLIENIDSLGNCTYCNYDALGRMLNTTKDGLTTRFTYEAGGLIASVSKPSGATTTRLYTTNGLFKAEIYPDGTHFSCIYDLFGRPIQEIKNGVISTIQYDDAAREELRCQGDLTEIRRFDAHGNLISYTDGAGYTWTKQYDALNRVKTEISHNGETTSWNYQGDTVICTLPSGEKNVQRYEAGSLAESQTFASDGTLIAETCYNRFPAQGMNQEVHGDIIMTTWTNTLGLPIRIQQGNKVTTHYYDACGNCIVIVDGEGNMTLQEFDSSGRLAKKTLPDGAIINYDYDVDSNLIAYRMPENLTWKAIYDPMGRKTSEWQEAKGKTFQRWNYTYNNGLLSQTTDPLNRQHHFEYDIHSRLLKESVGKYTHLYTYDPRGYLASATESGKEISKVERTYDGLGRIIQETIALNGTLVQQTQQSWSPSSRSLQIGDHKRDFHYQGGRLSTLSSKDVKLTYDYATSGSLIRKATPFSALEIQYNDSALPQALNVQISGSMYHESLQWTPASKIASYDSSYPDSHFANYTYTPRGYLKSTQDSNYVFDFDQPGCGIRTNAPNFEVPSQGVDEFGRIVKEMENATTHSTAYDEMGQVVIHDKKQFSWDPWGRIISIMSDTYEWTASYDALGRRLQTTYTPCDHSKSITTKSFYDPEEEFQEIGIAYGEKVFWKLYGATSCEAIMDCSGQVVVLHNDIRNNLITFINSQTIVWNKDYPTPYGPRAPPTSGAPDLLSYAQSLTWQSKRADPTGLVWLGARYYDPAGGRFLSTDPVSYPACLDLYAYANGDPINNVDLDGRFSSAVYNVITPKCIKNVLASFPSVPSFPQVCSLDFIEIINSPFNRSRRFDLSDLGRPELPNGLRIGLMNGIWNTIYNTYKNAEYASNLSGGFNIHAMYGATQGYGEDLASCLYSLHYVDTGRVGVILDEWNSHFDKNPDSYYLHICHSRGAIDTRNALLMYPEAKRKRIIVVAIAPAGYIYRETCARVIHYRADSPKHDFVPYIDFLGAEREKSTIVNLSPHQNSSGFAHEFADPMYHDVLEYEIGDYIKYGGR